MVEDLVHAPEAVGEIFNALVSVDGVLEMADVNAGIDEGGQKLAGVGNIDEGADNRLIIGILLVDKILTDLDEMGEGIIILVLPEKVTFGGIVHFIAQFEKSAGMMSQNKVTSGTIIVVASGVGGVVDDHGSQTATFGEGNGGIEIAAATEVLGRESDTIDTGTGSRQAINEAGVVTAITEAVVLDDAFKRELFGV